MADLRKFFTGAAGGAKGYTGGLLKAKLMELEQKREDEDRRGKMPLAIAQETYYKARTDALNKEKEKKPPTSKEIMEALQLEEYLKLNPEEKKKVGFPELFPKPDKANNGEDLGPSSQDFNMAFNTLGGGQTKFEQEANEAARAEGKPEPYPDLSRDLQGLAGRADSLKTYRQTGAWPQGGTTQGNEADVVFNTQEDIEDWVKDHPEDRFFLDMQEYKGLPRRK